MPLNNKQNKYTLSFPTHTLADTITPVHIYTHTHTLSLSIYIYIYIYTLYVYILLQTCLHLYT